MAALPPIERFATGVVDVTVRGAVPVATVDVMVVPDTAPVDATLDGVIAPSVSEMAGVDVAFATVPDTPFAVVTDTVVTVPVPVPSLPYGVNAINVTSEALNDPEDAITVTGISTHDVPSVMVPFTPRIRKFVAFFSTRIIPFGEWVLSSHVIKYP